MYVDPNVEAIEKVQQLVELADKLQKTADTALGRLTDAAENNSMLSTVIELTATIEHYEQLLQDIGIDPDLEYSTWERYAIRDALAGLQVAGIRA